MLRKHAGTEYYCVLDSHGRSISPPCCSITIQVAVSAWHGIFWLCGSDMSFVQGCEVIRMYETILGRDGFRKGMDLYFKRHDGCAVTCDDFLAAMSDANDADLSALSRWYGQAGTPQLTVSTKYDASAQTYTITTQQSTPPTNGQPDKVPVLIPIGLGLLGPDGAELPFTVHEGKFARHGDDKSAVLLADEASNTFVLSGVTAQPVPSLLRNFSAPVTMTIDGQTDEDLTFLMAHDTDAFNKCAPPCALPYM